jgi:hypothetical protein
MSISEDGDGFQRQPVTAIQGFEGDSGKAKGLEPAAHRCHSGLSRMCRAIRREEGPDWEGREPVKAVGPARI